MKVRNWRHEDRIVKALDENRVMKIRYRSVITGENTEREIEPVYTYTCDLGREMLVAYCRKRKEYRTFRFDGIKDSVLKYKTYRPNVHADKVVEFIKNKAPRKLRNRGGFHIAIRNVVSKFNLQVLKV